MMLTRRCPLDDVPPQNARLFPQTRRRQACHQMRHRALQTHAICLAKPMCHKQGPG